MTLAAEILEAARARGIMIATAESCTGGMVAVALTDLPGSSAVFERGFVTYTNAAKTELLGVREATLEAHGAVSEAVAAVSITGIAGPGGSEHKPEGRVCFALAGEQRETFAETCEFGAQGREAVRRAARDHALTLLRQALRESA
jgi:nicotinamide-nucleotide amidase